MAHEPLEKQADTELIKLYAETGDARCIGLLYERYGHLVLGLCIKYLKNRDEAADAVMQIFANLMKDLKKHRITYFKSWLYTYSKNFCLMELRRRQSALKRELEWKDNSYLIMDFSDPSHLHEKERQVMLLEQAIGLLNTEQKTCIHLFYIQNKSYNEICSITGFTANEVKSHIQNGKRNLKIKMEVLNHEQS